MSQKKNNNRKNNNTNNNIGDIEPERANLEIAYIELGNILPKINSSIDFENHCYWRIANDNACYRRWDTVVKPPFYKNASRELLYHSIKNLCKMVSSYSETNRLNSLSLRYRQEERNRLNKLNKSDD